MGLSREQLVIQRGRGRSTKVKVTGCSARPSSRPWSRRGVAAVTGLFMAFPLVWCASPSWASASTNGTTPWPGGTWQPDPAKYAMTVVQNIPLKMNDGVTLIANVGYPADPSTGTRVAGTFPVLLTQDPYPSEDQPNPFYVTRGYINAVVEVRGTIDTYGPGGKQVVSSNFGPRQTKDGVALVHWAAEKLSGSNGIVGASVGLALGDSFAAHYRREQRVAVAFFGDGGINTGRTWEALNLAGAWRLPLIAVCENNLYAVETPTAAVTGGVRVERLQHVFCRWYSQSGRGALLKSLGGNARGHEKRGCEPCRERGARASVPHRRPGRLQRHVLAGTIDLQHCSQCCKEQNPCALLERVVSDRRPRITS